MECPRCGELINDRARFCERCGLQLVNNKYYTPAPKEKNDGIGLVILIIFLVAAIGIVAYYFYYTSDLNTVFEDEHITFVKNGSPSLYPDITYDEAFTEFFSDRSWEYFESTDGQDVVEFRGNCMYNDVEVTATIQFILDMDDGTFELGYLAFNDVPQSFLVEYALIAKIFESY